MNAFLQLLHKQTAQTNELYNMSKLENTLQSKLELTDKTYNYELKIPELDDYSKLVKITFNILLLTPMFNTRTKFDFLDSVRNNIFFNDSIKNMIYETFYDVQKKYHLLNRLAFRYKYRKAPIAIDTDLSLSNIKNLHTTMTILQNNQKYMFTLFDLKKIIDVSLSNSPYHFSHPLPIKNPYNNLPFDKATLYNIYFFMKKSDFVMPTLFHQYFLSNFNLSKFQEDNEPMIQKIYLKQYLRNLSPKELKGEILYMLKQNRFSKKIKIDPTFPIDKLIDIFTPYLELYYTQIYSFDLNAKTIAKNQLYWKLKEFYKFNPIFGRKIFVNDKNETTSYINDRHMKFEKPNYNKNYRDSHIVLYDNDIDSDSDSDSEDDVTIVEHIRNHNIHVFRV
jgi:hypothetical protein